MHMVTCKYCGVKFDRDKENTISVGSRRYAHEECARLNGFNKEDSTVTQKEQEYSELENYVKKIYGIKNLNITIRKQIKTFKEEYGYTYKSMLETLKWWYEVKNNPVRGIEDGIGIIPHIYQQAQEFNYQLKKAKMISNSVDINDFKPKPEYVKIHSPRAWNNRQKKKLFKI